MSNYNHPEHGYQFPDIEIDLDKVKQDIETDIALLEENIKQKEKELQSVKDKNKPGFNRKLQILIGEIITNNLRLEHQNAKLETVTKQIRRKDILELVTKKDNAYKANKNSSSKGGKRNKKGKRLKKAFILKF